ncbi:MAG: tripartite tricarboxylate transporter TctB family protein [Clostridiales bacterium]|nr:tripartite tricarboxylate transporter TctB family protein [Clostridiales bacterium]
MKKIGTKQIVPLVLAVFAVIFAVIGFTQLGFWSHVDGPRPGFFPAIMAIIMFLTSIVSFFQSLKDKESAEYEKNELLVIAGGAGIIVGSYIIGLLPSCYLFIVLWLKVFEHTSWKDTLIVLAVCVAISVGVFRLWLGVYFPMGLLDYIL